MSSPEWLRAGLCACLLLALVASAGADPSPRASAPEPPPPHDQSAAALLAYQQAVLGSLGGRDRDVPLAEKAEFFEWQIWRYHIGPHGQAMPRLNLPEQPGEPVVYGYGADISTWNGALLAALSHKYAVTGDARTLSRIAELLGGMHLFFEATGQPGLPARVVLPTPNASTPHVFPAPDGETYHYRAEPAKGTLTQLVVGYAAMMMYVHPDLPEPIRSQAHQDLVSLVLHLVRHDYQITGVDGEPTRHGSLRPQILWYGVPFQSQVSYMLVAAAHEFPPKHPGQAQVIDEQFRWLRDRHPYWMPWWLPPFMPRPQRFPRSQILDANDLNHLVNATHTGLSLEFFAARREGREPDAELLRQLGETIYWSVERLDQLRNSLANFMCAELYADPRFLAAAARRDPDTVEQRLDVLLDQGVEQLRRFSLDRFRYEGVGYVTDTPNWVDDFRPDSYFWKVEPLLAFEATGPPTSMLYSAIDYLHAYWLLRHAGLDSAPAVLERHAEVLDVQPSRLEKARAEIR